MFGHPIARSMEKWWKLHGGSWNDPEWKEWIRVFDAMMEIKKKEMLSEHTNKNEAGEDVFGMAKAGGCTRASALSLLGYDKSEFSGSTKFTFWLGHAVEIAALATLHMAGYPMLGTQGEVYLGDCMASASDGEIKLFPNIPTIVSVKSSAYKMSGRRFDKAGKATWTRRGFPELPFEGVKKSQPAWYVQGNCEAYAKNYSQWLLVAVSKDIMKVFENDEYLGDKGNGSLTFYAELVPTDTTIALNALDIHEKQWEYYLEGKGGPAFYVNNETLRYVELQKGKVDKNNVWGGKNQELTGTFNPCGGCPLLEVCPTVD